MIRDNKTGLFKPLFLNNPVCVTSILLLKLVVVPSYHSLSTCWRQIHAEGSLFKASTVGVEESPASAQVRKWT